MAPKLDLKRLLEFANGLGLEKVKAGDVRLLSQLAGAEETEKADLPLFMPEVAEDLVLNRWGVLPYFDILTGTVCIDTGTPNGLNDVLDYLTFDAEAKASGNRGREKCFAALRILAIRRVKNRWLDAIPVWDGKPRFQFLQAKLGITDKELDFLKNWLRALVGMQVFRKELETHMAGWRPPMLILYGKQGGGKNWLLQQLCLGVEGAYDEGVSWDRLLDNGRDEIRRLKRCIIGSWDENPTGIGREAYAVKNFLMKKRCSTRGILEKFDDPDNVILSGYAGTSNFKNMLTDTSGNRRFQVIDVTNKKRMPAFAFDQILAETWAGLPAVLPKHSVPWKVPTEGESSAAFEAISNIFDYALNDAFDACKGLTTLRQIVDNITETEARSYYLREPHKLQRRLNELFDYDGEKFHRRKE